MSTEAKIKHTRNDDSFDAIDDASERILAATDDIDGEMVRIRRLLEAGERLRAAMERIADFDSLDVLEKEDIARAALAAYQEAAKE